MTEKSISNTNAIRAQANARAWAILERADWGPKEPSRYAESLGSFFNACFLLMIAISFIGATPPQISEELPPEDVVQTDAPNRTPADEETLRAAATRSFRPQNAMAIYVNAGNTGDHDTFVRYVDALKKRGLNAVVFDVKEAYVYFNTEADLAVKLDLRRPLYELPALVAYAKGEGLYTIARYVALKDKLLGYRAPETKMRNPLTGGPLQVQWVEPDHPTVLDYNREVLRDVAKSGVDEINLDYIRYPTSFSQTLSHIPTKEKIAAVKQFVQMARAIVDAHGKETKLGISTFAILGWDFDLNIKTLAQDVRELAPLVDVISPMAYPAEFKSDAYYTPGKDPRSRMYTLVYRTLEGYKELLGDHRWKLRPWIQGWYTTKKDMIDQMDAVVATGACGFMVWSQGNYYDSLYSAMNEWKQPEDCGA